jgi:hypothetical protein
MNNYITLGARQYYIPHGKWEPILRKPSNVRYTVNGSVDVTYGPGVYYEWVGEIEAPTSASAPWGDISTLRATLAQTSGINFVDHYGGAAATVHAVGEMSEVSDSPKWDGQSNKIRIKVRLVRE